MSLLDDVSIVVTPNAYKASKLYAVLPTNVEGSELITNGDFSGGTTGWNAGAGWSIGSGKASVDNASTTALTQSGLAVITGKKYNVSFEISDYVSGGFQFQFGGSQVVGSVNANGVYNFSAISTVNTTVLYLYATGDCEFKVDNLTCKQDTGADMSVTRATAATRVDENGLVNYAEVLGSERVTNGDFATTSNWSENGGANAWSISGGKANCVAFGSLRFFEQTNALATSGAGKNYKVVFTVSNYSQGTLFINVGGYASGAAVTSNGTHTQYIAVTNASSNKSVYLNSAANTILSVDNISVKEETRNNVPRIDYTGGGCPHILAEPQRTNLETKSNEFSAWTSSSGATATANYIVSPDGTQNASRIQFTGSGFLYHTAQGNSSTLFTISCYAKRNDSGTQSVGFFKDGSGAVDSAWSLTSDWKRFTYTYTSANTSMIGIAGTGAGADISVFGFQIEKTHSYATSYIPTSGSSVTRNQDQFTRDGIASLINSTAGVFFIEMAALLDEGATADKWIALSDGTANNSVRIAYSGGANTIRAYLNVGGSAQADMTYAVTNVTQFSKIAFSYAANNFNLWVDGVKRATDTSGNVFSANTLNRLGLDNGGGGSCPVKIKQLQVYKTALTDAQLTSLTS